MSDKKTCLGCGKSKTANSRNYYKSYNLKHFDSLIPYCKACIQKMCTNNDGGIDAEKFKDFLREINRPYLHDIYESSHADKMETIGCYIKNTAMDQYRDLGWKDSVFDKSNLENNPIQKDIENTDEDLTDQFVITGEMIRKWGVGYEPEQYLMLEDLYDGMIRSFDIENRSQEEYLKTACLYQMRNIEAIREGKSSEAKKWGDLFDSYMASGKLKPNQISDSDRMGGIINFSNFFKYVEKSNKFTPTFPDMVLDDIDYAIFMFINYNRELTGMSPFQLGDVKNFMTYDYEIGQEIVMPTQQNKGDD